MRIIRGRYQRRQIIAPTSLPVRPTTDMAKESLFNIIENHFDFEESEAMDLTVNQEYLKRGDLQVERLGRGYAWLDTGTHDAMLDAGNFIRTIETRQGLQVACLQEIAYQKGWMTKDQVRESCKDLMKTEYGKYLIRMIEE